MGGGSKVEAPKPTAQEKELTSLQIQIIKDQMADDELLRPFVLSAMRLTEDEGGALRQMTDDEYKATLSGQDLLAYNNLTLQLERQEKALKGELPLSEASVQQKATEFKNFKEAMARAGNKIEGDDPASAVGLSTSAIQALKTFNERWQLAEDTERRGELTSGQQLINQTTGLTADIGQQDWSKMVSFPTRTSGLVGLASTASEPLREYRMMQYQAGAQNAANQAGVLSGIGNLVGTLGAAAIYQSDPKVKKNIKEQTGKADARVLQMVKQGKTYSYNYKGEPKGTPKRVGLMATNAPGGVATPDKQGIDVGRHLGLLTAATKALAKKVERIESRRKA